MECMLITTVIHSALYLGQKKKKLTTYIYIYQIVSISYHANL
jgi:hypothetical protein